MKHFISLKYFSAQQLKVFLERASQIKRSPGRYQRTLTHKNIGFLFQKPSLRTKTSFYIGALQLGGGAIYYGPEEVRLGARETIGDVSRTLSRFLDAVVLRTFSHEDITEFVRFSSVPVINGLSDLLHPSQVLADMLTIYELKKTIKKTKVVYLGDGNNVCHSLLYAVALLGGELTVVTPPGYVPQEEIVREALDIARVSRAHIELSNTVREAVEGADVLYTDVWISMGKEREQKERRLIFKPFQINEKVLKRAKRDCIVMHCLPAHRGEEITDAVMESKNSVVFQQAQNRLHTAKAILVYLLKKGKK